MRVQTRILLEQLLRFGRRQRSVALLPGLVMAGSLFLSAAVCEQTTLLNNVVGLFNTS